MQILKGAIASHVTLMIMSKLEVEMSLPKPSCYRTNFEFSCPAILGEEETAEPRENDKPPSHGQKLQKDSVRFNTELVFQTHDLCWLITTLNTSITLYIILLIVFINTMVNLVADISIRQHITFYVEGHKDLWRQHTMSTML